jgi:hypothetical protein
MLPQEYKTLLPMKKQAGLGAGFGRTMQHKRIQLRQGGGGRRQKKAIFLRMSFL